MKKILINASNLHVGGGIQVASSFLYELYQKNPPSTSLHFMSSTEVHDNSKRFLKSLLNIPNYTIFDTQGFNFFNLRFFKKINKFDIVFTIFGPLYAIKPSFKSVVGFAQAWIIYPNNEVYKEMSFFRRIFLKMKYRIQGYFFKRADHIVVELKHVKDGLIRQLGIKSEKIHVIPNCLSDIYYEPNKWQSISIEDNDYGFKIGYLGRNYLHKNTKIFPLLAQVLFEEYNLKVTFFVTFTETEWNLTTDEFRAVCYNVGSLTVAQCPSFYENVDAVIFPSLLECFSITPLEAMAMSKPLFASDRQFNRDICGDYAFYFNPNCTQSAAKCIATILHDGFNENHLKSARQHAREFSDPTSRAESYLELINNI